MKPVPRRVFAAAITGRCKWGLSEWAHFVTLVCAQVAGTRSIRDLPRLLERHRPAVSQPQCIASARVDRGDLDIFPRRDTT
jgi:hypothetical protein